MEAVRYAERELPTRSSFNPWLVILFTAPIPLLLLVFFGVKWYQQKTDFSRVTSQFLQRQNTVLAYDALGVSTGFSDLLEKAARDAKVLALLSPTRDSFLKFYRTQLGSFTRFDTKNHAVISAPLPFYNRVAFFSTTGDRVLEIFDGDVLTERRTLAECRRADLCDDELMRHAVKLPVGEIYYGRILRYYATESEPDDTKGASLGVAYRAPNGIYFLGIDYLHLKDHLTTPVFPYDSKRDLMSAYHKGNYIYVTDKEKNVVTHPYYPHVMGIDRATGDWRRPMRTDDEMGKNPINLAAYENGRMKLYFERLLRIPLESTGVEIFQAPNLAGTARVLSVAPVQLSHGQYKDSSLFGHAIVGCSMEYFEEPKEKFVPYY